MFVPLPPAARLFMDLLAARLEITLLQHEIADLQAQLATLKASHEV
jgi:hypothetical protein